MTGLSPEIGRPRLPASYGIAAQHEGTLPWAWATERLARARNYWVVTASARGAPHAMPVWGLWREDALWFATDRGSRKGRNVAGNPRLSAHLESGDEVVIVEGRVTEATDEVALESFAAAYEAKYGFRPEVTAQALKSSVVYVLRPAMALAWRESDYPQSATRFAFQG